MPFLSLLTALHLIRTASVSCILVVSFRLHISCWLSSNSFSDIKTYSARIDIERRSPLPRIPKIRPKVTPGSPGTNGSPLKNGDKTPDNFGDMPRGTLDKPRDIPNKNLGNVRAILDRAVEAGRKPKDSWTAADLNVLEGELTRIQRKDASKRTPQEKQLFDKQLANAKKLEPDQRKPFQNAMVAKDSGRSALSRLDDVIRNNKRDEQQSLTWKEVIDKYTSNRKGIADKAEFKKIYEGAISEGFNELARAAGFVSKDEDITTMEFRSFKWKVSDNTDEVQSTQVGLYNTDIKMIVEMAPFKGKVIGPKNKQLPASELHWQSWKRAAELDKKSLKDLRAIIVHNASGNGGDHLIGKLLGSGTKERILEIRPGDEHWNMVIGSDNLKGFINMLADHSVALGRKQPRSVRIQKGAKGGLENLLLLIG